MKSTLIQNSKEEYLKAFPVDWIENIFKKAHSDEDALRDGLEIIGSYYDVFMVNLCQSVLSGEYIIKEQILDNLKELTDTATNEYPPIVDSQLHIQSLYKSYQQLDQYVLHALKTYRHFIDITLNNISVNFHDDIISVFRYESSLLSRDSFIYFLCESLFSLQRLDHSLSYSDRDIKELIILNENLLNREDGAPKRIKPIYDILKAKAAFLIKKMSILDDRKEYVVDFHRREIPAEHITSSAFQYHDTCFQFIHKDTYKADEKIARELQIRSLNKNIRIGEIVLLMKYYKDYKYTSHIQIENILTEFNSYYDKLLNLFSNWTYRDHDIYALNTLKNYMYNSRLSYYIKQEDCTYEKVQEMMNEISAIQEFTKINSYFPYKRALDFFMTKLQEDTRSTDFESEYIKTKIDIVADYLGKFEASIIWCKKRNYYPIQNLYNECIRRDNDFPVYTASSFCRPIRYDKVNDKLQEFKSEYMILKYGVTLFKDKKDIEQLKQDVEATKKSNIEILGAFSAIVTFLFGCVSFFSDKIEKLFHEQLLSIVCLGLILLLFISAIYFLTLRKEEKFCNYLKHPRFWVCGISLLIYLLILTYVIIKLCMFVE